MERGFVKLHRKFTEWEWYDDINTFRLFVHLILTANYKDQKWHGIVIKRGQKLTSISNLSKETKLTQQQVRTSIKKLKATSEITSEATNNYTLISIGNYELYQDSNKPDNKRITSEQQTDNKLITSNKKEKKEKNSNPLYPPKQIEENNNQSKVEIMKDCKKFNGLVNPSKLNGTFPQEFIEWWEAFPSKEGDKNYIYSLYFNAISTQGATTKILLEKAKEYAIVCENKEKKYVKSPKNWIYERKWYDEHKPPEPTKEEKLEMKYKSLKFKQKTQMFFISEQDESFIIQYENSVLNGKNSKR